MLSEQLDFHRLFPECLYFIFLPTFDIITNKIILR
jgi:hypothetical protein